MKDTKYAYASEDPHESPSFFAFGSHGLPLRHASIMFGHDSPVAHLEVYESGNILTRVAHRVKGKISTFVNNIYSEHEKQFP